jgi:hypothetical protein
MVSAHRIELSLTAALSLLSAAFASAVARNGQTLSLEGNTYYVPPTAVTTLKLPFGRFSREMDLVPLTVVRSDHKRLTTAAIKDLVNLYEDLDDVFNTGFLESMSSPDRLGLS